MPREDCAGRSTRVTVRAIARNTDAEAAVSHSFRHARLLQQFRTADGTVEDLARAWASMDGKREIFDAEKSMSVRSKKELT